MHACRGAVRILVIDDNPFVRRLFETRARQRTDVELHCAEDVEEAIHRIRSAPIPYHLIVCDDHLGRMDGIELVEKLAQLDLPVALIADRMPDGLSPNVRVLKRPVGLDELVAQAASGPR